MENMDTIIERNAGEIHLDDVHGQLSWQDVLIYYWSTKSYFERKGCIVDAGSLMGLSSYIFCQGASCNPKIDIDAVKLYVYDLFQDRSDGYSANLVRSRYDEPLSEGDIYDFEHIYRRNVKEYENIITIHKGDISKIGYKHDEPIEILSVDVAKTPALMYSVAMDFFPFLIPGHSLVLHQDYLFPFNPWINIAQEMLGSFFDRVYDAKNYSTSVFKLVKPITKNDIIEILGNKPEDYYHLQNVSILKESIAKIRKGEARISVQGSYIYSLFHLGEKQAAKDAAREWKTTLSSHYFDSEKRDSDPLAECLQRLFAFLQVD